MEKLDFLVAHVAPPKTIQTGVDPKQVGERELSQVERTFPGHDVIARPSLCMRRCEAFL